MWPIFLSDFSQISFFATKFYKSTETKISWKFVQWKPRSRIIAGWEVAERKLGIKDKQFYAEMNVL
jgi:hypothetical protein